MSSQSLKPRRSSTALDPYAAPHIYYSDQHDRKHARARTYSAVSFPDTCSVATSLTSTRS